MNFDLSEEQQLLADSVGRQLATHQEKRKGSDSSAEWTDYAALGLTALPFPETFGGLGGGWAEIMIVMEAFGRTLGRVPYLQSVLLGGRLLAAGGGDRALADLGRVIAGAGHVAFAHEEAQSRYRLNDVRTKAQIAGANWVISGHKIGVLQLEPDAVMIVSACTREGITLFLVDQHAPGVSVERRPTPDGRSAASVTLDEVRVPQSAVLGTIGGGLPLLIEAVDGAIAALCAEAVGAMSRLLEITVDYLKVRNQFGAPIGSFQALQHRAADMLVAVEKARSMAIYAACMMNEPAAQRHPAVAAAKAQVNLSSRFVGQQAIQLHGGMGLTSEYPAGLYFQRLTVIENLFGDTNHHLRVLDRAGGLLSAA